MGVGKGSPDSGKKPGRMGEEFGKEGSPIREGEKSTLFATISPIERLVCVERERGVN